MIQVGRAIPQLATEPVEPKSHSDILPRQCNSTSVRTVRASAIGSPQLGGIANWGNHASYEFRVTATWLQRVKEFKGEIYIRYLN